MARDLGQKQFRVVDSGPLHDFFQGSDEPPVPKALDHILHSVDTRWTANTKAHLAQHERLELIDHGDWLFVLLWDCIHHYMENPGCRAYLVRRVVLSDMLFYLQKGAEKGEPGLKELLEGFQLEIAHYVLVPKFPQRLQSDFIELILKSEVPIHPELKQANMKVSSYLQRFGQQGTREDLGGLLTRMESVKKGNSFQLATLISRELEMLHVENKIHLISYLASDDHPQVLEALTLFLLHKETRIRRLVPELIGDLIELNRLSPRSLRRMITVRNWLPEREQVVLDRLIRRSRLAGLVPGPEREGRVLRCYVSGIDGIGEQAMWLALARGDDLLGCRFMLNESKGLTAIAFWPLNALVEMDKDLARIKQSMYVYPMEPGFADTAIRYFLGIGLEMRQLPPFELLKVAEFLGNLGWSPKDLHDPKTLELLIEDVQPLYLKSKNQARIVRASSATILRKLTEDWFLEGKDIEVMLIKHLGALNDWPYQESEAIEMVCEKFLQPDQQQWVARLIWTAIWLKDATRCNRRLWQYCAIIAHALRSNGKVNEIPLMQGIARRTYLSAQAKLQKYARLGKARVVGLASDS